MLEVADASDTLNTVIHFRALWSSTELIRDCFGCSTPENQIENGPLKTRIRTF
jgi:hypothetical protein